VSLDTEFTEKPICKASRQYQHLKLQQLDEGNLDPVEYQEAYDDIVEKSCICVGLGTAALLANDLDTRVEGEGVSICPGPNMAYFSETVSLQTMTDHIYGRENIIQRDDRPHMFIKELSLYVNYLKEKIAETAGNPDGKQIKYLESFRQNLMDGIAYYRQLFTHLEDHFTEAKSEILKALSAYQEELDKLLLTVNPQKEVA
jgi:hypothetical protein